MAKKQYNVCVPREYKTRAGDSKTHFWQVGKMFPMNEKDGFNIQLYTRVLPTDKLVIFLDETQYNAPSAPPGDIPEDDIPF